MADSDLEPTAASGDAGAIGAAAPGARIDRYELVRLLGAGGMGEVYLAHDPELARDVALKLVRPRSGTVASMQQRLRREAQAMAKLSHANVVPVFDLGAVGDRLFIAMGLCEGGTLRAWMATPRSWRDVAPMLAAAGRGLAAAHAAGLVHRDFKPDNVLLDADRTVRVSDFGLVRHVEAAVATPELDGVAGTPAYMAPEQLTGRDVTAASDQYAFCVTLHEALFGVRPFAHAPDVPAAVGLLAAITAGRRQPTPRDRTAPSWLHRLIDRGLAADPARRWPSMDAIVLALERGRHRRRRRAIATAAIALVAIAATAVVVAARSQPAAVDCRGRAAAITRLWRPAIAAQLRAGFAATGRPEQARAAAAVIATIDGWGAGWVRVRTEACQDAAAGRGVVAERARRERCLEHQLDALDVRVALLTTAPTGEVVDRATAIAELPDPRACLVAPAGPARPDGDETFAIERELERLEADLVTGRYRDSLAVAEALVVRARQTRWPPVHARAALLRGEIAGKLVAPDTEAHLRAAIELASAAKDDALAVDAWSQLVTTKAARRTTDDLDAAILALRVAAARVDDVTLQIGAHTAIGFALAIAGSPADALASCDEARRLADDALPAEALVRSQIYSCLALAFDTAGRSLDTIAITRERLAWIERVLGPDHPRAAEAIQQLGTALGRLGHHDEMIVSRRRAVAITERVYGERSTSTAVAYRGLGMAMSDGLTRPSDEALTLIERSIAVHREIDPSPGGELPNALVARALLLQAFDRIDDAEADYREAIALLERGGAPTLRALARAHQNYAELLRAQQKWQLGAEQAMAAGAILRRVPGLAAWNVGMTLIALGDCHQQRRQWDQALAAFEEAVVLLSVPDAPPQQQANARALLSIALWDSRRDRPRALALADEAAAMFAAQGLEELGRHATARAARYRRALRR